MKFVKYLMMSVKPLLMTVVAVTSLICISACSDDVPEPKSEYALLGTYAGEDGVYMEIDDLDWIYQYNLEEFEGEKYWIKRKLTYFYEPVSELVLRQDIEGILQVDKVISNDSKELTLCWVETPLTEDVDGEDEDAKFEIIQVFFKGDYKVDPANYRHYDRITPAQLQTALGDIEIIEAY